MAQFLDAVQRFRKIEEATSTRDEPAPVYLLDEIVELAKSSPESAQAIADHVVKKLGHKSPVVKFKALRLVKHLINKGCSQFQRSMQRNSTSIRELQHFRGEQDPFKGDAPNARVREFSKEVLELLFNAAPVTMQPTSSSVGGRIQGFGSSSSAPAPGQYGGIGSTGISSTGIGSTSFNSNNNSGSMGMLAGLANAQPLQQALGTAASAIGNFWPRSSITSTLTSGADSPRGDYSTFEAPSYSSGAAAGSTTSSFAPINPAQVLGSEDQLVDDICAPGGLRPLPDPSDLQRFVDTASNMDGLRIAELLREKLEQPQWQVHLRAVCALEAVLDRGMAQACGEIAVMFQSDPSPVAKLVQSPQPSVRERAAKVYLLLTGEEAAVQPPAAAAQPKKPQYRSPVTTSLLGDEPGAGDAAGGSSAAAAGGGYKAPIDLLGDLEVPVAAPAAVVPAAAVQQQQPAAAAAYAPPDLLMGLVEPAAAAAAALQPGVPAVSSPARAAAAAAAAPAGVGARGAPLDEMFAGLSTHDSQPPAYGMPQPVAPRPIATRPLGMQPQVGMPAAAPSAAAPAAPVADLLGGPVGDLLGMPAAPSAAPSAAYMQQQPGVTPTYMAAPAAAAGYGYQQGGAAAAGMGYGAAQPAWGMPQQAGGVARPVVPGGSPTAAAAAANKQQSWAGKDDVSALMRHVATHGKHDPAFDFVKESFGR